MDGLKLRKRRVKFFDVKQPDKILPIVRRARPEDAQGIHLAHMSSIQEVCARDHTPEEIKGWGHRPFNLQQRLDAISKDFVWVVQLSNSIEGYGHLKFIQKDGSRQAYIAGLYLTSNFVSLGLGKQIVHLMLEVVKTKNCSEIRLDSSLTAHEFYRNFGFSDVGPMGKIEIGGSLVRYIPMRLTL